jgi:hypothetical protein
MDLYVRRVVMIDYPYKVYFYAKLLFAHRPRLSSLVISHLLLPIRQVFMAMQGTVQQIDYIRFPRNVLKSV